MVCTLVFYSYCCFGMTTLGSIAYLTYNCGIKNGLKLYMIAMTLPMMMVATGLTLKKTFISNY